MKQLRISPKAQDDIKNICDYVKKDGESIARKQASDIFNAIENLSLFPDMGIPLQKYVERTTQLKISVVNKVYIIVYDNGDTVDILRVFRKEQDFISILGLGEE